MVSEAAPTWQFDYIWHLAHFWWAAANSSSHRYVLYRPLGLQLMEALRRNLNSSWLLGN
jgi:hypothetical protein